MKHLCCDAWVLSEQRGACRLGKRRRRTHPSRQGRCEEEHWAGQGGVRAEAGETGEELLQRATV